MCGPFTASQLPSTASLGKQQGIFSDFQAALLLALRTGSDWFSPDRLAAAFLAFWEQIKSLSQQCQNCVPSSVVFETFGADREEKN